MTVEQGEDRGGGDEIAAEAAHTSSTYYAYPPPLRTYDDVVRSRDLFLDSLKKLHTSMKTKFMTPVVGGRDLDLHRLFVEVTSRGGIAKIMKEKRWKEVTAAFKFPSSATNASFIVRKYYVSLLYHYEQIYFFKAKCWTPEPTAEDAMKNLPPITPPAPGSNEHKASVSQRMHNAPLRQEAKAESSIPEGSLMPSCGSLVSGVINGKFECGYLITVRIGSEEFKGVLYQVQDQHGGMLQPQISPPPLKSGAMRRRRRKKSEIRKRDPFHPKPNRSGYNFFFAEQHARLKPDYHGKDREISRIIGDSWNKLQEHERVVYQEMAHRDKDRYQMEMEVYRERLRKGLIMSSEAPPLVQQQQITTSVPLADLNRTKLFEGGAGASACNDERMMSSEKSDKGSDYAECSQAEMELRNVCVEVMGNEAFDMRTRAASENVAAGEEGGRMSPRGDGGDAAAAEDGVSVHVEGIEEAPSFF